MNVSTTLLTGAIKTVKMARDAVMAVPGQDETLAQIAWELDEIEKRLEIHRGLIKEADTPRQVQLGFD